MRTQCAQGFATSRLRYVLVIVLSILLWFGLFYLVREGFDFMATLPRGIHEEVVQAIFNFFFFALFLMLIFSSAVILYGSLFRGGEVAYLLTMPIHEEQIFQHKFRHAVLLSSWGFLLLGSPMLVAYGVVANAPWYYYAMVPPMLVAFVFIPAGIGAILLLAIMHILPRKRVHLLAIAVAAAGRGDDVVRLVACLAAGNRPVHSPLVPGNAPPPATRPGEAAAQLVAQHGLA